MKPLTRRGFLSITSLLAMRRAAPALPSVSAASLPNIVIIMLDDLDAASVSAMETANRRIGGEGMIFSNCFATTPICGPSRASLLRGQYAHNHGVQRNTGDNAGFRAFSNAGLERETLATLLRDAGYRTALIGKYLNGYAPSENTSYIPPGWDYWAAPVNHDAYRSFRYVMNVNGQQVRFGKRKKDYLTDVLAKHAKAFLDDALKESRPFLLMLTPFAPHSPSVPAPRHKGSFQGKKAPRSPAFNERNNRDKSSWLKQAPRLSTTRIQRLDQSYESRLESLQAVDDMIADVMNRLDERGALGNTYIMLLSDNGYFLGDLRQPNGKDAPYDSATRVPFLVRGPGIAAGSQSAQIALNIDILPTVLQMAGVAIPGFADGRSLLPIMRGHAQDGRLHALFEGFGKETGDEGSSEAAAPPFRALRGREALYVEYPESDEREYFDLQADPYLLENTYKNASRQLTRAYSRLIAQLTDCRGDRCRELENMSLDAVAET